MSIFRDVDEIIKDYSIKSSSNQEKSSSNKKANEDSEDAIDIDSDSEKFGKYYIMEKDGSIYRSKTKLEINYEPLNLNKDDEKLGSYNPKNIINDLENISRYATDVKLTNYVMDSSEEEINNIKVLNKEYSNNVFKYVGGYKNMDTKYKNKLNKIKNKLDKLKINYPEYYYLNGGLKLDHRINRELTKNYISLSKADKIIKKYHKIKI
jgi:hypothetical protein